MYMGNNNCKAQTNQNWMVPYLNFYSAKCNENPLTLVGSIIACLFAYNSQTRQNILYNLISKSCIILHFITAVYILFNYYFDRKYCTIAILYCDGNILCNGLRRSQKDMFNIECSEKVQTNDAQIKDCVSMIK